MRALATLIAQRLVATSGAPPEMAYLAADLMPAMLTALPRGQKWRIRETEPDLADGPVWRVQALYQVPEAGSEVWLYTKYMLNNQYRANVKFIVLGTTRTIHLETY